MLTLHTLKLLNSGCFYLFGRDKLYRPCFVLDGGVINRINKENPEAITAEIFTELFMFLYSYVKNCMLLPGHVDQWVTIFNLNNLSLPSLPRKQFHAFG